MAENGPLSPDAGPDINPPRLPAGWCETLCCTQCYTIVLTPSIGQLNGMQQIESTILFHSPREKANGETLHPIACAHCEEEEANTFQGDTKRRGRRHTDTRSHARTTR